MFTIAKMVDEWLNILITSGYSVRTPPLSKRSTAFALNEILFQFERSSRSCEQAKDENLLRPRH